MILDVDKVKVLLERFPYVMLSAARWKSTVCQTIASEAGYYTKRLADMYLLTIRCNF